MAAGPGLGHPGSSEGMIADPEEGTCPIGGAGADLGGACSADATVEEESVSECIIIGVPGNGPADAVRVGDTRGAGATAVALTALAGAISVKDVGGSEGGLAGAGGAGVGSGVCEIRKALGSLSRTAIASPGVSACFFAAFRRGLGCFCFFAGTCEVGSFGGLVSTVVSVWSVACCSSSNFWTAAIERASQTLGATWILVSAEKTKENGSTYERIP
jgi:hypothetical protein